MFGELSLVANSGADFHKASTAVNMGGTWMQGLNLSSYQGSRLRYAVVQLQLLMQSSVGVCSHERKNHERRRAIWMQQHVYKLNYDV